MNRRTLAGVVALVLGLVVLVGLARLGAGQVEAAAGHVAQEAWSDALAALRVEGPLPPSATTLYDRGWVHLRTGDVPRAIAAFRAARELAPRDGALAHNLALARSELVEPVPAPVPPSHAWTEILTPGELGLLALLAWTGTSVAAVAWRSTGRHGPTALGAAGVALLLTVPAWQGRRAHWQTPVAVTVETAVVRDGTTLDAGERFVLPPGAELRAVARSGSFLLVEDGTGRRGWVLDDVVEVPLPGGLAR